MLTVLAIAVVVQGVRNPFFFISHHAHYQFMIQTTYTGALAGLVYSSISALEAAGAAGLVWQLRCFFIRLLLNQLLVRPQLWLEPV